MILYECHIFNIWTCLIHIWDDDSGREMVQNWFGRFFCAGEISVCSYNGTLGT